MTAGELIDTLNPSARLEVKEGKETLFCGWVALLEHEEKEEHIRAAQVKRFSPHMEITHKEWKEKGLMAPMKPEETPDYSFSDLQVSLYNTIYI